MLCKSTAIRKYLPCDNIVVEYRLNHAMIPYTARQEFQQPLFVAINKVWDYINQPASNPLQHFSDGLGIYDIPAFNREVVREAILNSVCHRAMNIQSDVVIKQYPDMLIITNAGGFPLGVDVDNILTVNSMPRCKRISEVLQRTGLVERSGQGVDKMFYKCMMEGKALPDYSATDDFQVCLKLRAEIQNPAFCLMVRQEQEKREESKRLNVFDLLALYRTANNQSLDNIDEDTTNKLVREGLLVKKDDGYTLSGIYDEFKKRTRGNKDNWKEEEKTKTSPLVPPQYPTSTPLVHLLIKNMSDNYQSLEELMTIIGVHDIKHFRQNYLNPAISDGFVERKYQSNHPQQRFHLTTEGILHKG